jgi:hypothetical protein
MNETNKTDNRSPWPACADCQAGDEEKCSAAGTAQPEPQVDIASDEDGWEQLEPSAELGPRREEVERQAREAFARALERARAHPEPGK